ncbi:hypothetical protein B0I37DRAFT_316568 [Chaetomium sp. MPI-CAGE-AT-0009]|nr:hypothetical protein B0I37DRAFT_316568 [Chaetomium sp. MPI-CAGE-AT-0009]
MRQEHRRKAHQDRLKRARELQRLTGPILAPGIDGVLWYEMRPPGGDEAGNPKTPILNILECTLKPDVDIHDGSQPPRQLWDAVLSYISSIPGCEAVEWGVGLDGDDYASPTALFCAIHWDSVLAWWRFQSSPGFSPLFALLGSDISNRCAKLSESGTFRLGGTQDGIAVVDVVTVTFDANDVQSPESRSSFGKDWNALVDSVTRGHDDGLRHSDAVWLENNVVTLPEPTPSETAVANKFATFRAFLSWNREDYKSRRVEELCDGLRTLLSASCATLPDISTKTVRFINEVHQGDRDPSRQLTRPYSLASILETDFPRQCSPNVSRVGYHYADILSRSMNDARAGTRLFPAPRGLYILIATTQGSFETTRRLQLVPRFYREPPTHRVHFLDVVWMQLTHRTRRTEAPRIYDQLNNEISTLPGCVKTYWARDPDHKKRIAVLTVWEGQAAREAGSDKYRQILDNFAASSTNLRGPLTHHAFPISRGDRISGPWLDREAHFEITRFYVSPGSIARQVFEHAYSTFARLVVFLSPPTYRYLGTGGAVIAPSMTVPSDLGGGPTSACDVRREAAWEKPIEATESDPGFQLFTGVMTWKSPEARTEWYGELFKFSRECYEMFGQTLDVLKILAAGGVESRFLTLQR